MAEVKKARLFLRRGTDTDRKTTTLCEGELGYSTDAFRVVIGDGSTIGGRALGSTAFISGGALQHSFHTVLTEASAGGYATKGDLAVAPASGYYNAAGAFVNVPDRWATTVMLLTADQVPGSESQSSHNSWVAVNSGIPWGNLNVLDDDISGDKVHGGVISGPITLSSGNVNIGGNSTSENLILSGVALSAGDLAGTSTGATLAAVASNIWPLGITTSAQVTAVSGVDMFSNTVTVRGQHRTFYLYTRSPMETAAAANTPYSSSGKATSTPTIATVQAFLNVQWSDANVADTAQILWGAQGFGRAISSHSGTLFDGWLVLNMVKEAVAAGPEYGWDLASWNYWQDSDGVGYSAPILTTGSYTDDSYYP